MFYNISVEPFIIGFVFTFVIYTSLTPQLILSKLCAADYNSTICSNLPAYKDEQLHVQKQAALWVIAVFVCDTVASFFGVVMWGPLTDIIGRKKCFMYITFAMGFQNLVLSFCAHFPTSSPVYILIASVAAGSYGNIQGVISICYSYMADITTSEVSSRTKRMAVLESCIFFSSAVTGLVSGLFLKHTNYTVVFLASCAVALMMYFYTLLFFKLNQRKLSYQNLNNEDQLVADPEYIHVEKFRMTHLNPFFLIKQIYYVIKINSNRFTVLGLLVVYLCGVMMFVGDIYIIPIYLKNAPFNFHPDMIGYYIAEFSFIAGLGIIIASTLSHRFNVSDYAIVTVGFISQIGVYVMTGLSRTASIVFTVRVAGLFASVITTTIRSQVSKLVTPTQYGCILGAVVAVDVIGAFILNFIGLGIYRASLDTYSGIVFFVIAGVSGIGLILNLYLWKQNKRVAEVTHIDEVDILD